MSEPQEVGTLPGRILSPERTWGALAEQWPLSEWEMRETHVVHFPQGLAGHVEVAVLLRRRKKAD